jgi:hypothetical protein
VAILHHIRITNKSGLVKHISGVYKITGLEIRVARFFLVQNTKAGKNIPNDDKIYQMAIKYFQ